METWECAYDQTNPESLQCATHSNVNFMLLMDRIAAFSLQYLKKNWKRTFLQSFWTIDQLIWLINHVIDNWIWQFLLKKISEAHEAQQLHCKESIELKSFLLIILFYKKIHQFFMSKSTFPQQKTKKIRKRKTSFRFYVIGTHQFR